MTEQEFRDHVAGLVAGTCGSAGALARKHGLNPKSLTLFLSGARGPSSELSAAFGYERRYVPLSTLGTQAVEPEREAGEAVKALTQAAADFDDIAHLAQNRVDDGDEMGSRVWRLALTDIQKEANDNAKRARSALSSLSVSGDIGKEAAK